MMSAAERLRSSGVRCRKSRLSKYPGRDTTFTPERPTLTLSAWYFPSPSRRSGRYARTYTRLVRRASRRSSPSMSVVDRKVSPPVALERSKRAFWVMRGTEPPGSPGAAPSSSVANPAMSTVWITQWFRWRNSPMSERSDRSAVLPKRRSASTFQTSPWIIHCCSSDVSGPPTRRRLGKPSERSTISLRPSTTSRTRPRSRKPWINARTRPRSYSSVRARSRDAIVLRISVMPSCPRSALLSPCFWSEDSRAERAGVPRGWYAIWSGSDRSAGSSPSVSIASASAARSEENVISSRTPVWSEYVATAARSVSRMPSRTNSRAARRAATIALGLANEKSKRSR